MNDTGESIKNRKYPRDFEVKFENSKSKGLGKIQLQK
jgi:hypothetical protein